MKWIRRAYIRGGRYATKTLRTISSSPKFAPVALFFMFILCTSLVWTGIQSLLISANLSSDANRYQAYAVELHIESVEFTNSASISNSQSFYAFSDPDFLKNLAANDPLFSKVFSDIGKTATSDIKASNSFMRSSDFMQKAADTATTEAAHEQAAGLIIVTFGSVLLGGLFAWLLSVYMESWKTNFEKSKKEPKRRRAAT